MATDSELSKSIVKSPLKVVTVLILCFVNLIYYADRFGIAGNFPCYVVGLCVNG